MAFKQKTWTDRVAEFINRRLLTKEDGSTELVMVARSEGTVSTEGDGFTAKNMNDLEQRIANEFSELNNAIVPQVCKTITDWNSATTNGWYMGSSIINAPTDGWYFGRTIVHNAYYVLQEVWGFAFSSDARNIPKYIRIRMNGTWSPWVQETLITASLSGTTLTIDI